MSVYDYDDIFWIYLKVIVGGNFSIFKVSTEVSCKKDSPIKFQLTTIAPS